MKIEILCIGKIKESYIRLAIEDFTKRLGPYCNLTITEFKDSTKEKESEKLLDAMKKRSNSKIIVLSEEGKNFNSVEFSNEFKNPEKNLIFIIGGPEGLTDKLKKEADEILSLSAMTFLHEMARLFLIEQIYRAQTIIKGKAYHK